MEDGAKENTALNIQKPLEILVTDEDKHGTDIACMSDFFGIYIEQLSAELSNQVMRGVVEKIPAADRMLMLCSFWIEMRMNFISICFTHLHAI